MMKRRRYIAIYLLVILLLGNIAGCNNKVNNKESITNINNNSKINNDDVKVIFINVGKADFALVMIGNKNYLIDTGTKESAKHIKKVLKEYNVSKLDVVFLTHTHKDYIGGLKKVSEKYDIDKVYSAKISMNKKDGSNVIDKLVDKLKIEHVKLSPSDTVKVNENVNFTVLGPITYNDKNDNDNSLVLKLKVNGKTILFTGDMQFSEETTLLTSNVDVSCDILKVGNHGNPDATSNEFAKAASPSIAVISTDTSVDKDSANERVLNLFSNSKTYITQEYKRGVLVTINKDGDIKVKGA